MVTRIKLQAKTKNACSQNPSIDMEIYTFDSVPALMRVNAFLDSDQLALNKL